MPNRCTENDNSSLYHCAYCGAEISEHDYPEDVVPALVDDTAWATVAKYHSKGCEWIKTRAQRQGAQSA